LTLAEIRSRGAEELRPFDGAAEIDAIAAELGEVFGALVVLAAETGLRPEEWIALERREVDRAGGAVAVQRKFASGSLRPYPKTARSRRRVPLTRRALAALGADTAAARYAALVPGRRGWSHPLG
jgi:integrase